MISRILLGFLLMALGLAGFSCREGEKPPKEKAGRAERDAQDLKEREAINAFARKLNELIAWRASADSPVEPNAAAAAIATRLLALPSDGLPDDLRGALSGSQSAWFALADALAKHPPGTTEVEESIRRTDAADGKLNQALAAKGFSDVAL